MNNNLKFKIQNSKLNESGQFLVFYLLFFTIIMTLAAMVLNTGMLVNYKMKLQTIADLASYAGASTMAYYMANTDPNVNSIAEYNKEIMKRYMEFLGEITLVNCSSSLNNDFANICAIRQVSCDINGNGDNNNGAIQSIDKSVSDFNRDRSIFNAHITVAQNDAINNTNNTIKKVISDNLGDLKDIEVYLDISELEIENEDIKGFGSYYLGRELINICSLVAIDNNNANTHVHPINVQRRVRFKNAKGNGYSLVGIIKKSSNEGSAFMRYLFNWANLTGTHTSLMIQAWSAAAPIRNIENAKKYAADAEIRTNAGNIKNEYFKENAWENRTGGHFQNDFLIFYNSIVNLGQGYADEKYTQFINEFNNEAKDSAEEVYTDEPDPLFYPNLAMKVRYIPLAGPFAGKKFKYTEINANNEVEYFGKKNPFKKDGSSPGIAEYLFSHLFDTRTSHQGVFKGERKWLNDKRITKAEMAYKMIRH